MRRPDMAAFSGRFRSTQESKPRRSGRPFRLVALDPV